VSRQIEARADRFALEVTGEPDAFIAMQQRLVTANLGDPDPPAAWYWFFGSHPTTAQRVALAEQWDPRGRP
jgi:STE24 endopeptidase